MHLKSTQQLAQTIPGLKDIFDASPTAPKKIDTLGDILSNFLNIAFYAAAFLAFYFLLWGGFQYILAKGNKENLAKARSRITWALVGLVVVFLAYFLAKFASEIFPPTKGGLPF